MYEMMLELDDFDLVENARVLAEEYNCEMQPVDEDEGIYKFISESFADLQEIGEQILDDDPTDLIERSINS